MLDVRTKEMTLMAPSDGNYIDSYGHLLINSGFIFTYLGVWIIAKYFMSR